MEEHHDHSRAAISDFLAHLAPAAVAVACSRHRSQVTGGLGSALLVLTYPCARTKLPKGAEGCHFFWELRSPSHARHACLLLVVASSPDSGVGLTRPTAAVTVTASAVDIVAAGARPLVTMGTLLKDAHAPQAQA